MSGASPREDDWGLSLIDEAIQRRDEAMVRLLVEHGARLDAVEPGGRTRLHAAASASDDVDAVAFLIRVGLDVNAVDDHGWTPLHCAAAYGYSRVAAALLQAGANPSTPTHAGQSPIELARTNGYDRWPAG